MRLNSEQVGEEATKLIDMAHHRKDIDTDLNGLELRDQYRVTKAMLGMNDQYETQHPDLPKIKIETFEDGQLKDLTVAGRLWGENSCYHRDKDPGVPQPFKTGIKDLLNGVREILDP